MALRIIDTSIPTPADLQLHQLREALVDIEELVDGCVDIDRNGNPNLAMRVQTVVRLALRREP